MQAAAATLAATAEDDGVPDPLPRCLPPAYLLSRRRSVTLLPDTCRNRMRMFDA